MTTRDATKGAARRSRKTVTVDQAPVVVAYKGFDQNLQCRGYQYELGKSFVHSGKVVACPSDEHVARGEGGFHACEHPLDVFRYYPPAGSRFAEVELTGDLARHDEDTKIAAAQISIKVELHISDLITRAVKWVMDRATPEEGGHATGDSGAASATGVRGAASATGDSGAASATGWSGAASATGWSGAASATGVRGAASATGWSGAASATGDSGAASATGDSGAASATGDSGAAMASGRCGRVMGADGCALFLVERDGDWNILAVWSGIAGRDGIKPLTWYELRDGKPVEVEP